MFTGIIETMGQVESVTDKGSGKTFWISSFISDELKIDQSISHDGACLTIEQSGKGQHCVTAVAETLEKTNLRVRRVGDVINLERSLKMNDRIDGHIVQGHVDTTASCIGINDKDNSWTYSFSFPADFSKLIIEKGSICVNGISLTAFNVSGNEFTVAIIPYTYENTNINSVSEGTLVNLEFDIIGKYIQRIMTMNK